MLGGPSISSRGPHSVSVRLILYKKMYLILKYRSYRSFHIVSLTDVTRVSPLVTVTQTLRCWALQSGDP